MALFFTSVELCRAGQAEPSVRPQQHPLLTALGAGLPLQPGTAAAQRHGQGSGTASPTRVAPCCSRCGAGAAS